MSIGAWLRKEAVMPITETKWWGDVATGKKPFTLASHNAIHADATKELGNNWYTRNPDATAAMILATIFSGGAASGSAGAGGGAAAEGGAAAGASAGGGAAAGGAAGSGAAAGGAASSGAAYEGGLAAGSSGAGYGLGGSAGATGEGLSAGYGSGTAMSSATPGATGTGLYSSASPGASADAAYSGSSTPGLMNNASAYGSKGMKAAATAQQVKGLLAPPQVAQAQAAPVSNQPADFSGLLSQYQNSDEQTKQKYQQYVQGLLGGGYGNV
jgi:hypothetical protein